MSKPSERWRTGLEPCWRWSSGARNEDVDQWMKKRIGRHETEQAPRVEQIKRQLKRVLVNRNQPFRIIFKASNQRKVIYFDLQKSPKSDFKIRPSLKLVLYRIRVEMINNNWNKREACNSSASEQKKKANRAGKAEQRVSRGSQANKVNAHCERFRLDSTQCVRAQ